MNCEETKLVLADYWSETLDDARELAFEAHIAGCETCRADAEKLGAMWKNLALIPESSKDFEPGVGTRTRFYEMLGAYRQGLESAPKRGLRERILALWPKQPQWQMAAGFAMLAIGLGIGVGIAPAVRGRASAPDSELSQLRGEVSNMRQMVALSLLQQQSASERLRGVSYAYQAPASDTQVLSALLKTVNQDDSVGVRLRAVDALHAFGASPVAREAIVNSIRKQTTPLVQIELIDLLVDIGDKDAKKELGDLSADSTVDPSVRQHASEAIGRLQ